MMIWVIVVIIILLIKELIKKREKINIKKETSEVPSYTNLQQAENMMESNNIKIFDE